MVGTIRSDGRIFQPGDGLLLCIGQAQRLCEQFAGNGAAQRYPVTVAGDYDAFVALLRHLDPGSNANTEAEQTPGCLAVNPDF
jgi:hypothetical protein